MPEEEKSKERKAGAEGKASGTAQGGRKAPQKAPPSGPSAVGVSLVWVVVLVVLLLAEGIYITAHSARGLSKLSAEVTALDSRAQQAQQKQISLAADYLEEAARYAAEENYGLADRSTENAKQMIGLAALLAGEIEARGLRTTAGEIEQLRLARGAELATQLQAIAEGLRGLRATRSR